MARQANSIFNDLLEEVHYHNINRKQRIVYLHAEHEADESGVDFRMATKFIKNMDFLNSISNDPITIKMTSYGGCWNYGMAIYDAIAKSPSVVTIESYAHSRSMSSIIPQAADKRLISKHCDFMIHYGSYGDYGDMRAVLSGMKFYEKANETMLNIYAHACQDGQFAKDNNMSFDDLKLFFKEKMDMQVDWWLSAQEAVYYGFMDGIIE